MNALPPDEFIEYAHRSSRLAVQPPALIRVVDEVLESSAIFRAGTGLGAMNGAVIYVLTATGLGEIVTSVAESTPAPPQEQSLLTIQEMVRELNDRGFSISNLAAIFDVSRPTIYSWIDGNLPQPEKQARVERVFKLLAEVGRDEAKLLPKMWLRKSSEKIKSIYEVLTAERVDAEAFDVALDEAMPLIAKMAERAARPKKPLATLVEETLAFEESRLVEWDAMPDVGKELPGVEGI